MDADGSDYYFILSFSTKHTSKSRTFMFQIFYENVQSHSLTPEWSRQNLPKKNYLEIEGVIINVACEIFGEKKNVSLKKKLCIKSSRTVITPNIIC